MKTGAAKLRWAGGGAQRPALQVNELKKTGARSARARTRGQNQLVYNIKVYGALSWSCLLFVVAERFLPDFSSNWDFPAKSSFRRKFSIIRPRWSSGRILAWGSSLKLYCLVSQCIFYYFCLFMILNPILNRYIYICMS
jgi:hypothetical protein